MKFMHLEYAIPILAVLILYIFFYLRTQKKFFNWVEDHWFFKQSKLHKISSVIYLIGLSLLLIAFMDPRGEEKHVSVKSSEMKTVIMIDTSASMLVEDVRPNRFEKAIFLAKHYVKKSIGQKISVMVFSDSSTKLVPFTEDKNLIEARLDSLKTLNLRRGGTGLTLALNEAVQYMKGHDEQITGNILIFTDAEEHEINMISNIPTSVNVGVIGLGTAKGGPIPIRNQNGVFQNNKKHKGEVVISKLNENNLKKIGDKIHHFRYWIASSYSLPTSEILHFFKQIKLSQDKENDIKIRPVLYEYFLIPGVLLIFISMLIQSRKVFIAPLLLCFFIRPANSQIPSSGQEPKEPVKSELTKELEHKLAKGELVKEGKFALGYGLLKDGFVEDADALYTELLKDESEINITVLPSQFNHAVAKIQNKKVTEGVNDFYEIIKYIENISKHIKEEKFKESLQDIIKKAKANILFALSQSGEGSGDSDSDSESEESQDKGNKSDSGSGEGQEQKDKSDPSDNGDNSEDDKNQSGDQSGQNEQENEPKDQSDQKGDKPSDQESEGEKEERKAKLPQLLKQLLSDDNKLQKKLIDANTTERKKIEAKDW